MNARSEREFKQEEEWDRQFAASFPNEAAEQDARLARIFASKTPEQTRQRQTELARYLRRELARLRRAGTIDERYAEDTPSALHRTDDETEFQVFASARGDLVRKRGAVLEPGQLIYRVWAVTFRQALWLATREVFASGPLEPGVLAVIGGDGVVLVEAPHVRDKRLSGAPRPKSKRKRKAKKASSGG